MCVSNKLNTKFVRACVCRYAAFDKVQREQKVVDLIEAVEGLTRAEAELALDMCDKNEIAAAERIMSDEEFLRDVREILTDRDRAELRRRRAQNRCAFRLLVVVVAIQFSQRRIGGRAHLMMQLRRRGVWVAL